MTLNVKLFGLKRTKSTAPQSSPGQDLSHQTKILPMKMTILDGTHAGGAAQLDTQLQALKTWI
jgi:hypothetical protein